MGCRVATGTETAGAVQEILNFKFNGTSAQFELFDKLRGAYQRKAGNEVDKDVSVGVVIKYMLDTSLLEHLLMHSKRLDSYGHVYF